MTDNITTLLNLAHQVDLTLCVRCLIADPTEAGTLDEPDRVVGHLTGLQLDAVDALIDETMRGPIHTANGYDALTIIRTLRVAAKIASILLPPVLQDIYGRYAVTPDDDGLLESAADWEIDLLVATARLRTYRDELTAGEWVDPYAVTGAVADIHDAARAIETLLALSADTLAVAGDA